MRARNLRFSLQFTPEYEYVAEEMTGDVVSDAVYNRNRNVEELLGINFNIISEPGHWRQGQLQSLNHVERHGR